MQVVHGVGDQSSDSSIALYSSCQSSIHNKEYIHGCYAILIVYHTMPHFIISYAKYVVRPDDPSKDISLLCFRACSSSLLVHPKGGRPRGARVVTSYMGVVLGYAGSYGYDHAPRSSGVGGRW